MSRKTISPLPTTKELSEAGITRIVAGQGSFARPAGYAGKCPDCDGPEDCKLVAEWTGEGWSLEVQTADGDTLALLAWPKAWPKTVGNSDLERFGFEVA
jgi:hypothetical protein